jgi:hypothetical protein
MKKIITAIIMVSTLLNGCGRHNNNNLILSGENIQISSDMGQNSAIKYGTVLETSFVKDHNGDHYRFNHLTVKYITDTDVYKNLHIAYSLDNQGVVFIWLTTNPNTPEEQHEMIDSGDMAVRTELAESLKTMRTLNSADKTNVSLTINILRDFLRNKSVTNKNLQNQLIRVH